MSDDPTLDDHRRAAALIALRTHGAPSSVVAFLSDPETAARGVQLLRAVDAAYRSAIADLRTELGVALLNGIVDDTVTHATEPRMKRAAQAIVAMRNQDSDAFTAVLQAANTDRAAGLLIADVVDCYAHLLPELASQTGRDAIATRTLQLAATHTEEDRDADSRHD